jgi:hypothetical protein
MSIHKYNEVLKMCRMSQFNMFVATVGFFFGGGGGGSHLVVGID